MVILIDLSIFNAQLCGFVLVLIGFILLFQTSESFLFRHWISGTELESSRISNWLYSFSHKVGCFQWFESVRTFIVRPNDIRILNLLFCCCQNELFLHILELLFPDLIHNDVVKVAHECECVLHGLFADSMDVFFADFHRQIVNIVSKEWMVFFQGLQVSILEIFLGFRANMMLSGIFVPLILVCICLRVHPLQNLIQHRIPNLFLSCPHNYKQPKLTFAIILIDTRDNAIKYLNQICKTFSRILSEFDSQ